MPLIVPPPVWGRPDGDVRLWVPFNGNLSRDISAYGQTATETAATIAGGQFTVLTGTTLQKIVWGPHASMGRTAQGWTLECFITWTSSDAAGDVGGNLRYDLDSVNYNFHVYLNAGKVALDTQDFGSPDAGPTAGNVLSAGVKMHMAMVHPPGSGAQTLDCYIAGTRVFQFTEPAGRTGTNGTVTVGKLNGSVNCITAHDDIRFTLRALYSGASFTPPGSPL